MMVGITSLWTIISLAIEGVTSLMIMLLSVLLLSLLLVRVPNLKFCQVYIFIIQILAGISMPLYINGEDITTWRVYLNGAASILWIFVEYQSFLMECISIIVSITVPIITLKMKKDYIIVCMLFMVLLIISRYTQNRNQRLLFLALQSFEQWEEAIEKTVPAYFIVSRFEFVTHQMYLHGQCNKVVSKIFQN